MYVSGCFSVPIHTHSEGRASKYGHPSVYFGSSVSPWLHTRCCNTHFPFSPVECSSPTLILFMTTTLSTRCLNWQHTFRFLSLPLSVFSLSIRNEEGPSDSLSKRGCQICRGSQLLPIRANGGARRPAPEPFDGAKLAHTRKKQADYHVFSRSWKILQAAGLSDKQRRFFFCSYE